VVLENRHSGTTGWRDGRSVPATSFSLFVSSDSAHAGEGIEIRAASSVVTSAMAEVLRIGDYGGAGARRVWSSEPFTVGPQPACLPRAPTALVECQWTLGTSFTVGTDWLSGIYVVRLQRADGARAFAPFVVRDGRPAEILFQTTFTTDQAYNAFGGESLYEDATRTMPSGRATQVSLDRPFDSFDGLGPLATQTLSTAQALERWGYDVTYASNLDFVREPRLLDGVAAFVVAGHDEYWTAEERRAVDAAVDGGSTSVVYLGANGGYWRIRLEPSSAGRPLRTITCFKGTSGDPSPGSTVRFRDPPDAHPENALFGIMYGGYLLLRYPLVVSRPESWVFAGTGLKAGDRLLGLVGIEFDDLQSNGATPAQVEVLGESPVVTAESRPGVSHIVWRPLSRGGIVFAAGSIEFTAGLSVDPARHDPRLERIVWNVLERAVSVRRSARPFPQPTGAPPVEPAPDGVWARRVEPFAGTVHSRGGQDGPGDQATFDGPTGLAAFPDGRVAVAEAWGNRIRLIDSDARRTVSTLAGSGTPGSYDADGINASFRSPTGVAIDGAGAIYVADSENHRIRRIDPGPRHRVTTLTGAGEGFVDGPLGSARFSRPTAVAFAPDGALMVADQGNGRIRRIDLGSGLVTTLAGHSPWGDVDGNTGLTSSFRFPSALAVLPGGDVLVVDAGNAALRKISGTVPHAVSTLLGHSRTEGFADGTGPEARVRAQMGLAITPGAVLFGDTGNSRVRELVLGATPEASQVRTLAGTGRAGAALGDGAHSDIATPSGLAVLHDGSVVVSDPWNQVVRRIIR